MQKGTHPGLRPPLQGGEQNTSPLGRGAAQAAGWVVHFIRCRRAAAAAIGAAVMSLMSIGGFALTSDHTHLVYQRDILKAATDAASIATSRHWKQALGHLTDDDQIKAALRPIAERYILANIPESRREDAAATLNFKLTLHHGPGLVDVNANTDLSGGVIFTGWMLDEGTAEGLKITRVESRTERIEAGGIIEVALAIDHTSSMGSTLSGQDSGTACREAQAAGLPCEDSRMTIVKRAAKDLVDILTATGGSVAIGVVPWHYRVQFDQTTRTRWEDNGWVVYPTRRYYPNPYDGSYIQIPRNSKTNWFPDPHLVTAAGEWHDLPSKPEAWRGCVDQRRMSGVDPPGISTVRPNIESFSMGFYSPTVAYPRDAPISFQCQDGLRKCFSDSAHEKYESLPQSNCGLTTIMPLTPLTTDTDTDAVKRKIDALYDGGGATYSTLGVVWGHRLLTPTWRDIWGDATHPVDKAEGVQKAIVLLTDGDDSHLDRNIVTDHRDDACTAAKNAGIKVFTIAAMDPSRVGELAGDLERCSSKDDDPEGKYVFVNNTSPDDLQGAFQEVARQLSRFRRVY